MVVIKSTFRVRARPRFAMMGPRKDVLRHASAKCFSSVGLRGLVVLMLTYSSMNVSLLTATQVPTTRTPAEITYHEVQ